MLPECQTLDKAFKASMNAVIMSEKKKNPSYCDDLARHTGDNMDELFKVVMLYDTLRVQVKYRRYR